MAKFYPESGNKETKQVLISLDPVIVRGARIMAAAHGLPSLNAYVGEAVQDALGEELENDKLAFAVLEAGFAYSGKELVIDEAGDFTVRTISLPQ